MRPRVFPAEDKLITVDESLTSFNEAAGIPRGRRKSPMRALAASMSGFNEAAGIPRGRRQSRSYLSACCFCFNEAAGIPRGRPARQRPSLMEDRASMRPRVFPAEDLEWPAKGERGPRASMRPRVFPAEDGRWSAGFQQGSIASMRPRVFPAEDVTRRVLCLGAERGFNEAAGIPRGRLIPPVYRCAACVALQ